MSFQAAFELGNLDLGRIKRTGAIEAQPHADPATLLRVGRVGLAG